ncbi:uncharacterized protein Tco025E_00922 [Trypanosoma conorhini]|uniref:Uncharacterized protein n=1 Tax=Trypanosoma conorhini TaxID=83891 RepID=A0A3R7LL52_9TRYP|nr:uncharacterized protein Tco025E_00922 [Trypanosoma conorhini]RNF26840.1 hypothetical protein Tco025E_00922 [Trypanosoma conorhini]
MDLGGTRNARGAGERERRRPSGAPKPPWSQTREGCRGSSGSRRRGRSNQPAKEVKRQEQKREIYLYQADDHWQQQQQQQQQQWWWRWSNTESEDEKKEESLTHAERYGGGHQYTCPHRVDESR